MELTIHIHTVLITSKKGSRRGDHYHKESEQYVYVLSGKMQLITQKLGGEPLQTMLESGDLVHTPPLESHAFLSLEDSTFLAISKGPRGGKTYEDDTYRLSKPLQAE